MKNCDTPKRGDLPLPIAKIFEYWSWWRKHQKECPLGPTLVKNADDMYHLCKPKHLYGLDDDEEGAERGKRKRDGRGEKR